MKRVVKVLKSKDFISATKKMTEDYFKYYVISEGVMLGLYCLCDWLEEKDFNDYIREEESKGEDMSWLK